MRSPGPGPGPDAELAISLLTYSTKPRGSVVHTLALAEALAAAGQRVTVWTLGRGGDTGFFRDVDPAVQLRVVPFPDGPAEETVGERVLRSIETLRAALAEAERETDEPVYDIVHAQDCIAANAALAAGLRCVRTVHHIDHFSTPELVACHDRAITQAHAHVCVSKGVARELADGWGMAAEVIPNGVDYARFAHTDPAARTRWKQRLGRYVLTVGGIEPRKGSLDLLDAYAILREQHPDTALVIAGGETLFDYRDYRAQWEQRAKNLAVEPVVLGPVPDADLPALVAAADAFAFPSLNEGFGLAAMEALAAGVPLVVRDLPILREVFGRAAHYAATPQGFAAQLAAILDGRGREAVAAVAIATGEGRRLAAGHSWQTAANAHIDFYRKILCGGLQFSRSHT